MQPLDPQAQELPIADLPDELLHNLNPTRYCESDHLSQETQAMFGQWPRGLSRVQAIVDWIHQNIAYQVGTTNAMTTARDVLANRTGVCRDFAHLGVTFCRALNIPARLVVGYARFDEPPPDFHAMFEAYLGGRWVMFDATHMSPIDNLVRVATGRDAKDVAFATIYGPATMRGDGAADHPGASEQLNALPLRGHPVGRRAEDAAGGARADGAAAADPDRRDHRRLQPSVITRLASALKRERETNGTAMLIVEQNVSFALQVADRYSVLKRGEIVAEGDAAATMPSRRSMPSSRLSTVQP